MLVRWACTGEHAKKANPVRRHPAPSPRHACSVRGGVNAFFRTTTLRAPDLACLGLLMDAASQRNSYAWVLVLHDAQVHGQRSATPGTHAIARGSRVSLAYYLQRTLECGAQRMRRRLACDEDSEAASGRSERGPVHERHRTVENFAELSGRWITFERRPEGRSCQRSLPLR